MRERPQPDPGLPRPSGNSLYARAGGVYPLALFADRLVDALVADARFGVPTDDKRTPAALVLSFHGFYDQARDEIYEDSLPTWIDRHERNVLTACIAALTRTLVFPPASD